MSQCCEIKNGWYKNISIKTVCAAIGVRLLLILHSLLSIWRVVEAKEDLRYWTLLVGVLAIIVEGCMVIKLNEGGKEWARWCPCILLYILTNVAALWVLQLAIHEQAVSQTVDPFTTPPADVSTVSTTPSRGQAEDLFLGQNQTGSINATEIFQSTKELWQGFFDYLREIFDLDDRLYVIILQEIMVYQLVLGHWLLPLPDEHTERPELPDGLLRYLVMASDIVELYTLFDENAVLVSWKITNAILAVCSVSLIQFIPVPYIFQSRELNANESYKPFLETLMGFVLQDGPFLCLRLYVMIHLKIINSILMFFVLKNSLVVALQWYKMYKLLRSKNNNVGSTS